MDAGLKKILKPVTLALRHLLEGEYDVAGQWKPGDLERRLASLGVRRDRAPRPVDELGHLTDEDRHARKVVDAYLKLREEAGVELADAVAEFVRETAYTWANRLIALRCMEARELIDSVIQQKEAYGGRSLEHHRLAQRQPELCAGEDDGLFAVLDKVFREQTQRLPMLFDPQAPGIALHPSATAIKDCFGLLSLNADALRKYRIRIKEDETAEANAAPPNPFVAPDALGWTYQYWNTEEKVRVFEMVRTVKNAKIAGSDIVPATQLYTEDYMVKFLVQNSLGATWMGMHPDSKLCDDWDYYVRDADRAPVEMKPVREITFLDPACGSGHFLIEAFDLYFAMYLEEGELTEPAEICTEILTQNLFGIDIDARAVQIAEAALWMKAAERSFDYDGAATNLVAATASHLKGPAWEEFLASFTKEPSVARVLRRFAQTMEHIDEIGSLARPAEDLRAIIEEEHATWEKQHRELRQHGDILFQEMREDAVRGQLPFLEISDGEFGDELFYRAKVGIDAFTEQARESGAFDDQMLANETRAGFRLLDLLSRGYDVVTANPPYMGKTNMPQPLRSHIERAYLSGKRDLYAAFMLRCQALTLHSGRVAVVVPQTWMFLSSFADLRSRGKHGVLHETAIEAIAQLGRHAFSEVDPPSNVVLICSQNLTPHSRHRVTCFRLVQPGLADVQARLIADCIAGKIPELTFTPQQAEFTELPLSPLAYWLGEEWLSLFHTLPRLEELSYVREGLHTTDNVRFLRCFWECPEGGRWFPYLKGGGYGRWAGMDWLCVDWQLEGTRIRRMRAPVIPSRDLYFRRGYTYTDIARGSLGARFFGDGHIFDAKGPVIIARSGESDGLAAVVNSRPATFLLRGLSPTQQFRTGYVNSLPVPLDYEHLAKLGLQCVAAASRERAGCLTERLFHPNHSCRDFAKTITSRFAVNATRLAVEGVIETQVFRLYNLGTSEIEKCCKQLGTPAGWLPLISGYTEIPDSEFRHLLASDEWMHQTGAFRENGTRPELVNQLKSQLADLFRVGFGGDKTEDNDSPGEVEIEGGDDKDENDAPPLNGMRSEIPAETFLEELSRALSIHPISVFWMVCEGIAHNGWRCRDEEYRCAADCINVAVLRCLGFRWPQQIHSRQPIPNWAEPDGIIPLSTLASETTLFDHVQQRLIADDIDVSNFTDVMAKPLDAWLATEFFKHHTKQFKKRPIAWQVQSDSFTARSAPAIACLIYYHKLDSDLLRKVRKLAEDLRKSRETELRGILSVAPDVRTDRQLKRHDELENAVVELQRFDATLETVAATGFGCDTLRQYAINDALLALKARWLRRLSELVAQNPLRDWLNAANQTDLHPDFGSWIANAMSHLDHFCARVDPRPPEQKSFAADPTAADLATLIAAEADTMLTSSIRLACDVWWKSFDDAVLQPLKTELKGLKDEQKQCEARLKADPEPEPSEVRELKARVKELKAKIKELNATITKKSGLAEAVQKQIEAWRSNEPRTWGDWLAEQPLFDQISSLDNRRPPPTTIAEFIAQESLYAPDINDGVRVNIAPLQKAGLLAADVLAAKDLDKAIADRADWRSDERRWVREGKLPQPGWWSDEIKT